MLSAEHYDVLTALSRFEIGPQDISLTFQDRLARDNGWSEAFTTRVIAEYKRFVFLAKFAGHPVTPSDQVDQAWHLHLVYTESYWKELCGEILSMELHHGPTKGGKSEGDKFRDWYGKTLESYNKFFGAPPPRDIWPGIEDRFRNVTSFRRLNLADSFVIPKRTVAFGSVLLLILLPLIGCIGAAGLKNPLTEYNADEFLFLYGLLLAAVSVLRIAGGRNPTLTTVGGGISLFGIARIIIGMQRSRPIGFLAIMVAGALAFTFVRTDGNSSGGSGCGTGSSGCGSGGCGGGGCGGCGS